MIINKCAILNVISATDINVRRQMRNCEIMKYIEGLYLKNIYFYFVAFPKRITTITVLTISLIGISNTAHAQSGINELSSTTVGSLNGKHLIGIQEFTTPVKITPTSASINLGFKMDGMFHLKTNWQTKGADQNANGVASAFTSNPKLPVECTQYQNPGNACLKYVMPSGFEFSVSVE
jgi:hypothetical protein